MLEILEYPDKKFIPAGECNIPHIHPLYLILSPFTGWTNWPINEDHCSNLNRRQISPVIISTFYIYIYTGAAFRPNKKLCHTIQITNDRPVYIYYDWRIIVVIYGQLYLQSNNIFLWVGAQRSADNTSIPDKTKFQNTRTIKLWFNWDLFKLWK